MTGKYAATSTTTIQAPTSRVWSILTDHDAVKEFMFDTDVVTDWTIGGPIVWRVVWAGKEYEDRGRILEFEPGRRFVITHFSPLSARVDTPGNYHTLTWTLEGRDRHDRTDALEDNNASAEDAMHAKGIWDCLVAGVTANAERK